MKFPVTLFLLSAALAQAAEPNPPKGFTALFNGKNLDGWWGLKTENPAKWMALPPDQLAAKKKASLEDIKKHWKVEYGVLVNDGSGLYLSTEWNYGNFELYVDYKIVAKADSGIYLRGVPQVQIWDKGSGGLWNNPKGGAGKDPKVLADKPLGQWNTFHVTMMGDIVTVVLNDKLVVDKAPLNNFWDRGTPLAKRKPLIKKGPIQLQTHGGKISWRNIYLKELDRNFPKSNDDGHFRSPRFDGPTRKETLNRIKRADRYPDDPKLDARIKSYELAYRMQTSVPGVVNFDKETEATKKLYGFDQNETRPFGQQLLAARRFVERGVRFIQIMHGDGAAGAWDQHSNLKSGHTKLAMQVDRPIAGLLKDLKSRGLLDETLVVFATEFGRTPGSQGANGRDHPYAFSIWMAGGGLKGGVTHGATDDIGFHTTEDPHFVTDMHATLLHQLGLDPHAMEVPGHKRLEQDFGHPIQDIIA